MNRNHSADWKLSQQETQLVRSWDAEVDLSVRERDVREDEISRSMDNGRW